MNKKTIFIALTSLLVLNSLVFQACKKEEESNQAPECTITSPTAGEEFSVNEVVTITAVATDSDGVFLK